jgi:O2-independent ubiquinone biosynthesis accessory factor UbiT
MQRLAQKQRIDQRITAKVASLLSPKSLGTIATMCPFGFNKKLISYLLNDAFVEQVADGDFEFLQGRNLMVELIDAGCFIGISYVNQRLLCNYFDSVSITSDATLSLNSYDAILLIEQTIDPDTLFFQRKLKISGDTELAHQAKNTIDTLDQERIPKVVLRLASLYRERFALST